MAEDIKEATPETSPTDEAPVGDNVAEADDASPKAIQDPPKTEPTPSKPVTYDEDEDVPDSILGEFLLFLKEEKKWWLAPLVIVLLMLSAVIIFAEGSAIAPFIYTIF